MDKVAKVLVADNSVVGIDMYGDEDMNATSSFKTRLRRLCF
jgi:hypothetical protein